jgi:TatD DNase family protein
VLVDTHAHLSDPQFDPDREEALLRAFEQGVGGLVEIADNESEWPKARALAERHPGRLFWSAGLHPHYADKWDDGLPARLRDACRHPQLVAVGEIGLDYFRNPLPPELQRKTFAAALRVAVEADKPVVLHCREKDPASASAQEDMLAILKDAFPGTSSVPRGVAHCFQGRLDFAKAFMALGFFIGVDGPLTYPNASPLRALFRELPLDRIVLETDSPYLPPQDRRGGRNEPSFIEAVARALAALKGVAVEDVRERTSANAEKLYRVAFDRK